MMTSGVGLEATALADVVIAAKAMKAAAINLNVFIIVLSVVGCQDVALATRTVSTYWCMVMILPSFSV